jgi:hypothetical protein
MSKLPYDYGLIGLVTGFSLISKALEDFDDLTPVLGSADRDTITPRDWYDSAGRRLEQRSDGRVFYNGSFIGHRDAGGAILDGSGNYSGTLTDDGTFYSSDGQYVGRFFN